MINNAPEKKESVEGMGRQVSGTIKVIKERTETGGGFGFITPADGSKDIYFHFPECVGGPDWFKTLFEGMRVSFKVQNSPQGPMALNVVLDTSGEVDTLVPKTENTVAGILNSGSTKEVVADSPECSLKDEAFRIDSTGWKPTILIDTAGNSITAKVNIEGDVWELNDGVQLFTPVAMVRETKNIGRENDIMTAKQAEWLLKNIPNNVPEGCKFTGFLNSKDGKIHFAGQNACYWIGEFCWTSEHQALFCIDINQVEEEMRPYTDEMIISEYDTKSAMQVRLLKKKTA